MKNIRELSRRLAMAIVRVDGIEYAMDKDSPISDSELCLMYALDDGNPHSQRQIADDWEISRTTLNTIVKHWEQDGLLTLNKIAGKRREMEICLTEKGTERVKRTLALNYAAEDAALALTMGKYSDTFIEALEFYADALKAEYEAKREKTTTED